jgi:hypothetical protein
MPTLKPFRDYSEHEVINLFGFEGATANKGTFVKPLVGWTDEDELQFLGAVGASYTNTVSERYGVKARVVATTSGDLPIGMLLYDVRETDENGEQYKFNPRKAAENNITISGQACPILKRGIVNYSGLAGTPSLGGSVYSAANGELSVTGTATHVVGRALGLKDSKGFVLIEVNL